MTSMTYHSEQDRPGHGQRAPTVMLSFAVLVCLWQSQRSVSSMVIDRTFGMGMIGELPTWQVNCICVGVIVVVRIPDYLM